MEMLCGGMLINYIYTVLEPLYNLLFFGIWLNPCDVSVVSLFILLTGMFDLEDFQMNDVKPKLE